MAYFEMILCLNVPCLRNSDFESVQEACSRKRFALLVALHFPIMSSWVIDHFRNLSSTVGHEPNTLKFAEHFDNEDTLAKYRNEFAIPIKRNVSGDHPHNESELDKPCNYLCGNSLGLMPKRSRELVQEELEVWATRYISFETVQNRR
ncbi:hypothetical protein BJV82DRAFT_595375 [Fennellomyces sp. T-0311]|nr:hypothetical protein BJV82DRAFT_595375 [Fennellomyces sp. T-0311]